MRKVLGIITLLTAAHEARADDLQFYTPYRSPYFLGRGGAGMAVADNHEAIFYNPAGLAEGKGLYKETVLISPSVQISNKTKDLVSKAVVGGDNDAESLRQYAGKNMHFGANTFTGVVFRRFAIGGLVSADTNLLVSKDPAQNGMETLHADATAHRMMVMSVAENFWGETIAIGTTLKYMTRNEAMLDIAASDGDDISKKLEDDDVLKERAGYGADVGVMFMPKTIPFRFGLHIENLGTMNLKAKKDEDTDRVMPQIVTLGVAAEQSTRTSTLAVMMDFRDALGEVESNVYKRLHLGAEIRYGKLVGLTGGLNQGYPTVGFFFNVYVARLDVGLMTQEMGTTAGAHPDQRIMFRLMAGF